MSTVVLLGLARFDAVAHGERHREPLGTTDWRHARDLEKKKNRESAMMAVYSHVRWKALDEAAKPLEPDLTPAVPTPPDPPVSVPVVISHVTSQQGPSRKQCD